MKRRTATLAVGLAALLTVTLIGPAHAEAPAAPALSGLDSSTPGHLTGVVTSPGAPYVSIRIGQSPSDNAVTLAGDSDSFDLPTWGYQGATSLYVSACRAAVPAPGECSAEILAPETFVPTDLAPTSVAWSTDLTVGPGQKITATTEDDGGGHLQAQWFAGGVSNSFSMTSLDRHGSTDVQTPVGTGTLHVLRCSTLNTQQCVDYSLLTSPTYKVRPGLSVTVGAIAPISIAHPSTSVVLDTDANGRYDLDWHLISNGATVPGSSGSVTDLPLGATGRTEPVTIAAGSLSDGTYGLTATLVVRDPDFGTYTATVAGDGVWVSPNVTVDRTAPSVSSISFVPQASNAAINTIYPRINVIDRPGSARVRLNGLSEGSFYRVEVRRGGVRIRQLITPNARWNGTDQANKLVSSGTYDIVLSDTVGNTATTVGHLRVDTRRRVVRKFTRTVTARASLVDSYVGRCSTLRRPAARGWKGSLGFYANTRCGTKTWRASAASTMHATRLPAADKYISLSVGVYGAAATVRPKSFAGFRLYDNSGHWRGWKGLGSRLGWHPGASTGASDKVFPSRYVYWGMATAEGGRYDVKSFRVKVQYYVLA